MRVVTGHAGLEAGRDGVDGARLGPERPNDLRHRREEALFVCFTRSMMRERRKVRTEESAKLGFAKGNPRVN